MTIEQTRAVAPGPYRLSSDAERAALLERTGGEPVLDFTGPTPYAEYMRSQELLSLISTRSGTPGELVFYVIGQVQELLFKLLYDELRSVGRHLAADEIAEAIWQLHRIRRTEDLLVSSWDVIGTLTPTEFNAFRDHLGAASGFQSYGYRKVEYALGNKVAAMARPHSGVPEIHREVQEALHEPSVYDEAVGFLARHGAPIATEVLTRDRTRNHPPHPDIEAAWADVYRRGGPADQRYQLAEALIAVAEGFSRWRSLHLLAVERVIGTKPGTGGTSGVTWLREVNKHRFFPELWSARSVL